MPSLRVCMIGAFKEDYPRNQIIRVGLERMGVEVDCVHLPIERHTRGKLPVLFRQMDHLRACDVVLVPPLNQLLVPFIWTMCQIAHKPLVVDYMVGLTDAIVHEREEGTPIKRVAYWQVDRFCVTQVVNLTDTQAHIALFEEIWRRKLDRTKVLPVGVYDDWFHEYPGQPTGDPRIVQFFGNYIPFHGVDVIVEAIAHFRGDPSVHFELIGRGKDYYERVVKRAKALELDNVTFIDHVPSASLPERVAQATVCLGVFGARTKTDYVVPNKVFQSMAIGRPVITAEAPAIREFFVPGEHLVTVAPGDPDALAEGIAKLLASPEDRARIGAAGAARIREAFLPQHMGRILKDILLDVLK